MSVDAAVQDIKAFWEHRARQFGADSRATLGETTLRELEIRSMIKQIQRRRPSRVLDVGCANGYATKRYARAFPDVEFVGVDYSSEMIRIAREDALANVSFQAADVLDASTLPGGSFGLAITQRCIQNVPDWAAQREAIRNMLSRLAEGGSLLLMECSKVGVTQLNDLRERLRLPPIEGIEPWHNNFLDDERMIEEFGAKIIYFSSTYMFLVKVIHRRLRRIAWRLPAIGRFGYDRLYVIDPRFGTCHHRPTGASPPSVGEKFD